jgi:hypothetical protein
MPLITPTSLLNKPGKGIRLERSHVAEASKKEIKKVRSLEGYLLTITVGKGIPIWMTQEANQSTRSVGSGMRGSELAREFIKVIEAGHHPFEPWITASLQLGGSGDNTERFNDLFNIMVKTLENDVRVFGGKNGDILFEKWFSDEVVNTKHFKQIKVGNRSFKKIFNSVLQPMGPRSGKPVAALQTLVNSGGKVKGVSDSFLAVVPKGLLGTFSGSSYNLSRRELGRALATTYLYTGINTALTEKAVGGKGLVYSIFSRFTKKERALK